jgi:molecular chaperone DnaK (HSP70)
MKKDFRYSIGIDLGTTHCALSYIDSKDLNKTINNLDIIQTSSLGEIIEQKLLPSVIFIPPNDSECSVGYFAELERSAMPDRVVHSAKSWFVHDSIDINQKFLPFGSDVIPSERKYSPLVAATKYLEIIKKSWNIKFPDYPLASQGVTVTVPASFDVLATENTLKAAINAGFSEDTILLEEPHAAFLSFLHYNREFYNCNLKNQAPLNLLVIDVGGGTTDFSLFLLEAEGDIERIAVGPHLLIGGDNFDLAIAKVAESLFKEKYNKSLSTKQWSLILYQAKKAKEQILSDMPSEEVDFNIPTDGSDIFAENISVSILSKEIIQLLINGFFPKIEKIKSLPISKVGLRSFGLAYESNPAITYHLLSFIEKRKIHAILCTGGTLTPKFLQIHLKKIINDAQGFEPLLLPNNDLFLAVATGAALFQNEKISGIHEIKTGYPANLYLLLPSEQGDKLLCILPRGTQIGSNFNYKSQLLALLGREVKISIFLNNTRDHDRSGDILNPQDIQCSPFPTLSTILECNIKEKGKSVFVNLVSEYTELGRLKFSLFEQNTSRSWDLLLNLSNRDANSENNDLSISDFGFPTTVISKYYGKDKQFNQLSPRKIFAELEEEIKLPRKDWTVSLLRSIWNDLQQGITRRGRSLHHELQFFNLAGFVLRPGYGFELDEFRIKDLWRCHSLGLAHPKERQIILSYLIMWRRVAGGLSFQQQEYLYQELKDDSDLESIRLIATLERLPVKVRLKFAWYIVELIVSKVKYANHLWWCLTRLISRMPVYGGIDSTLPPNEVLKMYDKLENIPTIKMERAFYETFIQGFRYTGVREVDIPEDFRLTLVNSLQGKGFNLTSLTEIIAHEKSEVEKLIGENLPTGLRMVT